MINNKIVDNLILFFLSILVITFLSYDSHKLGFFADDISIIGDLSKINDRIKISKLLNILKHLSTSFEFILPLNFVWTTNTLILAFN